MIAAGVAADHVGAMTHSELAAILRASVTRSSLATDRGTYIAWRTAALMRSRKLPPLARLLRKVKRRSAEEKADIRAAVAAADVEFERLEAEARRRGGGPHG